METRVTCTLPLMLFLLPRRLLRFYPPPSGLSLSPLFFITPFLLLLLYMHAQLISFTFINFFMKFGLIVSRRRTYLSYGLHRGCWKRWMRVWSLILCLMARPEKAQSLRLHFRCSILLFSATHFVVTVVLGLLAFV